MPDLVARLADRLFADLARQFRLTFLPPLMVYFAAGVAGLTSIVGTFFVKDYLDLSAEFLAGLAFWASLPWALKMPLGHLVDIIWRYKEGLVFLGAGLIGLSLAIMYALLTMPDQMAAIAPLSNWFVASTLLAPAGYVIQDAVADAMSVEAVPKTDKDGNPFNETQEKAMHTTMQTLGRMSLFVGLIAVALLNISMFEGIEQKEEAEKTAIYSQIYLIALGIPLVSVSGVIFALVLKARERSRLLRQGFDRTEITKRLFDPEEKTEPNMWIFGGGALFVVLTLSVGLSDFTYSKEIIFLVSMVIVTALVINLSGKLSPMQRNALFGTAIILFIFRATPSPGPGIVWFEIDELGFDQQFLSVLALITSVLALTGMIVLRPLMAERTIATLVVILSVLGALLALPNIALYYGLHEVTSELTGGVVDQRFIAILDTAAQSPLAQIAVIPMLAWIARYAPTNLKATFFAVLASFSNLALSAADLFTSYINRIFIVTREVVDRETGEITVMADYSELGILLWTVLFIGLVAPIAVVAFIQMSPFRTRD
ncbi:MAG: hypothetical protein AAGE89_06655 [Pseudomonadota bacterium]